MLILLFSMLWGGLVALILCAPYGYYPFFYSIFIVSVIIFFIAKKYFRAINKYFYIGAAAIFFISYALCTYLIFKPKGFNYPPNPPISEDKKAVIFYCEGEMEKYTPYYSIYFLKDTPLLLKPVYSMEVKRMYKDMGINTKNNDLLKVAVEVKQSILNYKPYYFYIAMSGYVPSLNDSISSAISDGCGDITIINYSADYNFEEEASSQIDTAVLESMGINIKFTKPVHSMKSFADVYTSYLTNLPEKYDGILIMDNKNNTSETLKSNLTRYGYKDSQIVISKDIPEVVEYFENSGAKSLFYLDLFDSSSGLKSNLVIGKEFEKYSGDMKIVGKDSWGYEKGLVRAAIDSFLDTQKK